MGGVNAWRPTSVRSRSGGGAGALLVPLVIASLIATCGGPTPSPTAGNPSPGGQTPSASTATPEASSPPSQPQAWIGLELTDVSEVARLEPTKAGAGGVAPDTAFRLTSLDGRDPGSLAARLVADPPLTFRVASVDGTTAIVRPATALHPGVVYRISLSRSDGTAEASWAAQAAGPLRIVETIPGDQQTQVPLDTGIEVAFDQYGVSTTDLARYFTINPATEGRFEPAGRTIAFVPTKPLAAGRLYTVAVRHGLPLAGTGQVLESDVVVRFETAAALMSDTFVAFARPMVDSGTGERAAFGLVVDVPVDEEGNEKPAPDSIPIAVHRLADMTSAITAWRSIRAAPDWTRVVSSAPVDTTGLPLTLSGTVRLQKLTDHSDHWIQLPDTLPAGWYVVTLTWGRIARQTLLQVTDLATFALVAVDRSAVWVNNLKTMGPATGASVSLDGTSLGTTDDQGLLTAKTPTAVVDQASALLPLVVVRSGGRSAFLPVATDQVCAKCDLGVIEDTDSWWRLFSTDRLQYRATDTVNAWGVIRDRDSGKVPAAVRVILIPDAGDPTVASPIAAETATPDRMGSYAVRLAYRDLPSGDYRLRVTVGSAVVADRGISVGPLVKPAYSIQVSIDKHAIISGAPVKASVHAAFFEGTPVAGTELTLSNYDEPWGTVRTNALGDASRSVRPTLSEPTDQWAVQTVQARPTLPEEGEMLGETGIAVFRSTAVLDTTGRVTGTQLVVTGHVNDVAFARFESATSGNLWEVDPRGAGRANAVVRVQVTERIPVLKQTGTTYDFILKRVSPVYDVSERSVNLGTKTVRTSADGSYRVALGAGGSTSSYEISASYVDEAGRKIVADGWVPGAQSAENDSWAYLQSADPTDDGEYSVGDTVRVSFLGGSAKPPVARYLFAINQRGLRYVTVGTGSTFRTTFAAGSVPSVQISGVRFNGYGYEPVIAGFTASLHLSDRALAIKLTPDRARYAPGDTASVAIRTVGPDGTPVSASVFVRAVDEKLYAMGAAGDNDPLPELYGGVGTGILGVAASHGTPNEDDGMGGGDTTGGGDGDRTDFRDWLVARIVTTDGNGRARISVPLSDDLTSWRVTASGVDAALEAGHRFDVAAGGPAVLRRRDGRTGVPLGGPADHPSSGVRVRPQGR